MYEKNTELYVMTTTNLFELNVNYIEQQNTYFPVSWVFKKVINFSKQIIEKRVRFQEFIFRRVNIQHRTTRQFIIYLIIS